MLSTGKYLNLILIIFNVIIWGSVFIWLFIKIPYFICLSLLMKLMSLLQIFLGDLSELEDWVWNSSGLRTFWKIFLSCLWNLPFLSTVMINCYPLYFGRVYWKLVDSGWLEQVGRQGLFKYLKNSSQFFLEPLDIFWKIITNTAHKKILAN